MSTQQVWKYVLEPLEADGSIELAMPYGAEPLHAGEQAGRVVTWWRVDPHGKRERRRFHIVGTGHGAVGAHDRHIGTVQMATGYVWHVFEKPVTRTITAGAGVLGQYTGAAA